MNAVAAAQAKGWRAIYFNWLTFFFWGVHIAAFAGAILAWSWTGLALAIGLYGVRMFFITGVYHRYFSHRTYKTSRWFQFVLAVGATASAQKGPLWWAAHHRHHHKASDEPDDLHSPYHGGFFWSHFGWFMTTDFEGTDDSKIKDFAKYPELQWLGRYYYVPVVATAVLMFATLGTWGLLWGFAVAQMLSWHGTFTINSLSHMFGKRRYDTSDDSRNNWVLGLITLGEGWHNNHHHYQSSARQGFHWWQIDITYYILRGLAAVGLIWDIRGVPAHVVAGVRKPEAVGARAAAAAAVAVVAGVAGPTRR